MIKPSTKIKKGTKYIVIETGDEVTFDNVTFEGLHLVNYPNGNWHAFQPDELKPATKKRTPISKKPKQSDVTANKAIRTDFFTEVAKDMPFNCMNCQKPLYAFSKWSKRCVSAHVIPKSLFPSVAENKDNIVFMGFDLIAGICDCHTQYDYSLSNRMSMRIYTTALSRFELLKPCLTNPEIIKGMEYLGIPVTTDILKQLK